MACRVATATRHLGVGLVVPFVCVAFIAADPRIANADRGGAATASSGHVAVGYIMSPAIAQGSAGAAHALSARFDRAAFRSSLELGIGIEAGFSGGDESLTRFALLPGIAYRVARLDDLSFYIEERAGWQIVRGRLTLDGIPLRGTETRSWHNELAFAAGGPLTNLVELRARVGVVIDGIYPAGHASTRVGPFVGVAIAVELR